MKLELTTPVDIPASSWKIGPCERMLFVGSCFADNMGQRFVDNQFRAVVNPYGVMYNPASILHTVNRLIADEAMPFAKDEAGTAVFTLGTNHVYILRETGEIVDNCQKRPPSLFEERELTVDECADCLRQAISLIHDRWPGVRFILTVSPIRYRKYGYHGSRLSKATLLLAVEKVLHAPAPAMSSAHALPSLPLQGSHKSQIPSLNPQITYFPAYEIMDDELRDYRFYRPDMLHPTDQAVEYIYQRMSETFFVRETFRFLEAWKPIREALSHRPFHPDCDAYKAFMARTEERLQALKTRYPQMPGLAHRDDGNPVP